ncbi:berberine bridge enzyme-like 18 [Tripterygium wilfordii]|nr:berberine bridge enzyme-like 18 [Tripterygium wilfordii]
MTSLSSSMFPFFILLAFAFPWAITTSAQTQEAFLECLFLHSNISKLVYTPANSSYSSVLQNNIQNLRLSGPTSPKPQAIITPTEISHIQSAIYCARTNGLEIRTRSGGHDYEGLSYVAYNVSYIIIDLINFKSIDVDVRSKTAWVQSGARVGEICYRIAEKSNTLGFTTSVLPKVGAGGYISGGGFGTLMRKYGLAADNVIDAVLIDAKGRVRNRKSMGEELFWAIRGGTGASFGVIISWRIKLVEVPANVTVFGVSRILEQNATALLSKWQNITDKLSEDLFIRVLLTRLSLGQSLTMVATFQALFLGSPDRLLRVMQDSFPELNVTRQDCLEISWIQSVLYFGQLPLNSTEALLNLTGPAGGSFKAKSDYVREPIPISGLQGLWQRFFEPEGAAGVMILSPHGGRMSQIKESSTPYPHRAGTIYIIEYLVSWTTPGPVESSISWIRRLYDFMATYVSKNPREAYANYRDLDIGSNSAGNTSYSQSRVWGLKYFKDNFDRLVRVKTKVDPANFFRNEQSIPPRSSFMIE